MKRIPEDVRGELALEALRRTRALALASMLIHLSDPDDVKEEDKDSFQPTLALRTVQALKDEWLQQIRIRAADAGMIDAVGEAHDAQLGSKVGPLRRAFFSSAPCFGRLAITFTTLTIQGVVQRREHEGDQREPRWGLRGHAGRVKQTRKNQMQFCSLLNIPYHVEADRSSGMDANMLGTRVSGSRRQEPKPQSSLA